jgi:hypothetical protein
LPIPGRRTSFSSGWANPQDKFGQIPTAAVCFGDFAGWMSWQTFGYPIIIFIAINGMLFAVNKLL